MLIGLISSSMLKASVSQQEALNISIKLANDSTSEIWGSNKSYVRGDTLQLWYGNIVCPFDTAWLFFIDNEPMHNWSHKCTYVYVDANKGECKQLIKSLPPINLIKEWSRLQEYDIKTTQQKPKTLSLCNVAASSKRNGSLNRNSSSNLYAIIIDFCGQGQYYNYERFRNDCALVYNMLCDHGYSHENIYVAMPNNEISEQSYYSSSIAATQVTDFNGDGLDDVDYPATCSGVETLFADLNNEISENDMLFVYMTGHGDMTVPTIHQTQYSGFLQDGHYNDNDLVDRISSLDVNIVNVVIQRNCADYLYDKLYSNNTQNKVCSYVHSGFGEADYIIDEYTERFVNAIYNVEENIDMNLDGFISMYEAHEFALTNTNNTGEQYSKPYCLKHELSINSLKGDEPCVQSNLYIKDNTDDYGGEPNNTTEYSYISPDIWIEDMSGNIVDHCISNENYNVCVRIKNNGNLASSGEELLYLHWSKAVIGGQWPNSWTNESYYDCDGTLVNVGGYITPEEGFVLPVIDAYDEYIARIPWVTPDNNNYVACSEFDNATELWHYCLLARIYDEHEQPGIDMQYIPLGEFVLNSNNVASKNITIMNETGDERRTGIVGVIAPYTGLFSLECAIESILDEFPSLYIYMNTFLNDAWERTGGGFEDEGDRIRIDSEHSLLTNLFLEENRLYSIKLELENVNMSNFLCNITLIDEMGEKCGGESFQITENSVTEVSEYRRNVPRVNNVLQKDPKMYTIIDNQISIEDDGKVSQVSIFNIMGQMVLNKYEDFSCINIADFPIGVYTIIISKSSVIYVSKFTKQ